MEGLLDGPSLGFDFRLEILLVHRLVPVQKIQRGGFVRDDFPGFRILQTGGLCFWSRSFPLGFLLGPGIFRRSDGEFPGRFSRPHLFLLEFQERRGAGSRHFFFQPFCQGGFLFRFRLPAVVAVVLFLVIERIVMLLPPFLVVFPFLGYGICSFLYPILGRQERAPEGEFPRKDHGCKSRCDQDPSHSFC